MMGLYCIVLSSGLKALIMYSFLNACIVLCGLGMMTYILITSGRRIFKSMYVAKEQATSSRINSIQDPTNIQLN